MGQRGSIGLRHHMCRICGACEEMESFLVREMMWNTGDSFEYFVCPECNTLQIDEVPQNLEAFYGDSYYSFQVPTTEQQRYLNEVANEEYILDVGCGNGQWLLERAEEGYGNLFGCDPYVEDDIDYGNRVHIKKAAIQELEGIQIYDIIRFGDSLEHMVDPVDALENARRLLKPRGCIAVNIPIFPNIAYDMFGVDWFQIDAPRHIFIPSRKTLEYFEKKCGLRIVRINYNSSMMQITSSYLYEKGVPLYLHNHLEILRAYFSEQEMVEICKTCAECNKNEYGDHVEIYMVQKERLE